MKHGMIVFAMLCSTLFASEDAKFTTRPAQAALSQKDVDYIRILPENLEADKFYRLTMQIKMKSANIMTIGITCGKNTAWARTGEMPAKWQKFCQYIAPGEAWNLYLGCVKGNTMQVKDIKLEVLNEKDFTVNLLPDYKAAGWHNAWGSKNEAKIMVTNSNDSPFGTEIIHTEIDKGTGFPAIQALPILPNRTLVVDMWVKGEPEDVWLTTLSSVVSSRFTVKKEWGKQQVKFKIPAAQKPSVAILVFWINKLQDARMCEFGKIEAYYEE